MDEVRLCAVSCRVRLGVTRAERARPQRVFVDVALETDISRAAARDDLRLAVDYHSVERVVRETSESGEWALVETLAERIAGAVLRSAPGVLRVRVVVRKRPAAMPRTREVAVSIVRQRK